MKKSEIRMLFDYNYWANEHVLSAAARVTPAQFIAPARLSHGSLRGALVHILGAEVVWRTRCQEGISPAGLLAEGKFPTLESLRLYWDEEQRAMRAYLDSLADEALFQQVSYTTTKGIPQENVLWQLLVHLVNHGTQFRSEAGIALTEYGHSPGDLDLIEFLRSGR
jgi:uncharacterized damage-inducible protein DinB